MLGLDRRLGDAADRSRRSTRRCPRGRPTARRSPSRRRGARDGPGRGRRPRTALDAGVTSSGGPSWSPDGRSLAFIDAGGQVWTARADGSGAHQVTYTLAPPRAAPRAPGLVARRRADRVHAGRRSLRDRPRGLVRRSRATSRPRRPCSARFRTGSPQRAAPARSSCRAAGRTTRRLRLEPRRARRAPRRQRLAEHRHRSPRRRRSSSSTTCARRSPSRRRLHGEHATIDPGRFFGFATRAGRVRVHGRRAIPTAFRAAASFVVTAAGHVTAEAHAPLRYGSQHRAQGRGRPGGRRRSRSRRARSAPSSSRRSRRSSRPAAAGGSPSPRRSRRRTRSRYGGATAERLLRVMPNLRVSRNGGTVARLAEARRAARPQLRLPLPPSRGGLGRSSARPGSGRAAPSPSGTSRAGRYYVAFAGGDAYWSTATEPFTVRR